MKRCLYILTFAMLTAFTSYSQDVSDKDILAVKKLLNSQVESWNKGDVEGYMLGYWRSDSLAFVTKDGITYGWENVLNRYKNKYGSKVLMGNLNFSVLKTMKLGDKIHVTGKWELVRETAKGKEEFSGYSTLILEMIEEEWRIIMDHTS